jgi:hypothetical protein
VVKLLEDVTIHYASCVLQLCGAVTHSVGVAHLTCCTPPSSIASRSASTVEPPPGWQLTAATRTCTRALAVTPRRSTCWPPVLAVSAAPAAVDPSGAEARFSAHSQERCRLYRV